MKNCQSLMNHQSDSEFRNKLSDKNSIIGLGSREINCDNFLNFFTDVSAIEEAKQKGNNVGWTGSIKEPDTGYPGPQLLKFFS